MLIKITIKTTAHQHSSQDSNALENYHLDPIHISCSSMNNKLVSGQFIYYTIVTIAISCFQRCKIKNKHKR